MNDQLSDEDKKQNDEQVKISRPPNIREDLWFQYLENLPFRSDNYLSSFAEKLITVDTALIAAYVAALKLFVTSLNWYFLLPPVLLFVSLLLSIYSLYPRRVRRKYSKLSELKKSYYKGLDRRWYLVTFSLGTFLLGLIAGIVTLMYL